MGRSLGKRRVWGSSHTVSMRSGGWGRLQTGATGDLVQGPWGDAGSWEIGVWAGGT